MSYGYGTRAGSTAGSAVANGVEPPGPGKQTLVEPGHAPAPSSARGGDKAGESKHEALGGDEVAPAHHGEAGAVGAVGGDASTMGTAELAAATWSPHGEFKWWIKWTTNGTKGWIVQRIVNTYSGTDNTGGKITNAAIGVTPSYYEAWEVDAAGKITGSLGGTGNRDRWERPSFGDKSKGKWSMTGTVYWTSADPAASGFTSGGVGNAGSLLSSVSAPKSLSGVLANRSADGEWDSTGAKPTHTGKAS